MLIAWKSENSLKCPLVADEANIERKDVLQFKTGSVLSFFQPFNKYNRRVENHYLNCITRKAPLTVLQSKPPAA